MESFQDAGLAPSTRLKPAVRSVATCLITRSMEPAAALELAEQARPRIHISDDEGEIVCMYPINGVYAGQYARHAADPLLYLIADV